MFTNNFYPKLNGDPDSDGFEGFNGTISGWSKEPRYYSEYESDTTDDGDHSDHADGNAEVDGNDDVGDDGYYSEEERDPYTDPVFKLLYDYQNYPEDFYKFHDTVYPPSFYPVLSDSETDSDSYYVPGYNEDEDNYNPDSDSDTEPVTYRGQEPTYITIQK
jgi:hypothetical protein